MSIDAPVYVSPINAAHVCCLNEELHKYRPGLSTAVLGQPFYDGQNGLHNSRMHTQPLWRVLLNSGSDGDIVFQQRGTRNGIPYVMRGIGQAWHMSHGIFRTEKQGELDLVFPEYSHSKRVHLTPDIAEYHAGCPTVRKCGGLAFGLGPEGRSLFHLSRQTAEFHL